VQCPHCFNGIKDIDETGIDCGGNDCNACEMPAPPLFELIAIFLKLRIWIIGIMTSALIVYLFNYLFIPLKMPEFRKIEAVKPFAKPEFQEITLVTSSKPAKIHEEKIIEREIEKERGIIKKIRQLIKKEHVKEKPALKLREKFEKEQEEKIQKEMLKRQKLEKEQERDLIKFYEEIHKIKDF
jgi:hypothetical protein